MGAPTPRLTIIAAVARNGVIGRGEALPWHISGDLKHFRSISWGKPIVMGRRTFASIGRPLPGRTSVVVTRDSAYSVPEGVHRTGSLDAALALAAQVAAGLGADEIMVIGGAEIYAQALPRADRLRLTEVHGDPVGDVLFPALADGAWRETSRDGPHQGPKDEFAFSFVDYERDR